MRTKEEILCKSCANCMRTKISHSSDGTLTKVICLKFPAVYNNLTLGHSECTSLEFNTRYLTEYYRVTECNMYRERER